MALTILKVNDDSYVKADIDAGKFEQFSLSSVIEQRDTLAQSAFPDLSSDDAALLAWAKKNYPGSQDYRNYLTDKQRLDELNQLILNCQNATGSITL